MKVRFQADADLNEILVKAVLRREPGIDFQTAVAAKLQGMPDKDVLALASRSGRLLVTHDRKAMPKHFAEFIETQSSAGVLIVPQKLPVAQVAEEWTNRVYSLPL
jgi:hypothetical protein